VLSTRARRRGQAGAFSENRRSITSGLGMDREGVMAYFRRGSPVRVRQREEPCAGSLSVS
jgi:hypothetical protein